MRSWAWFLLGTLNAFIGIFLVVNGTFNMVFAGIAYAFTGLAYMSEVKEREELAALKKRAEESEKHDA